MCPSLAIAIDDRGNKASVLIQSFVYTHTTHIHTSSVYTHTTHIHIRGAESAAENTSLGCCIGWETARHLGEGVGNVD